MEIKYLKNNPNCNGDMYMKGDDDMHLIVMSKDHFTSFANDEGEIFGHYQKINMASKEYNALLELAKHQDRKKGITLLNSIHNKNPNLKDSKNFFQKEIPFGIKLDQYDLFINFENSTPILE